jgi:hypothetical protein
VSETVYRNGEWIIAVDRWGDTLQRSILIRIARERRDGVEFYGPNGWEFVPNDGTAPALENIQYRFPVGCEAALATALSDRQEPSERLTNKLEQLLDREATRVDRLIEGRLS